MELGWFGARPGVLGRFQGNKIGREGESDASGGPCKLLVHGSATHWSALAEHAPCAAGAPSV